jgi:glutathione synthase/RimK-type ligase-like ATP-grasp enzyme
LAEHDALFIRTVTGVDNVSFRFAQTAESLGMPVIDDPQSILRCSNKVYLYELCRKHGFPTLRSSIVSRKTTPDELRELGFPLVLKVPDGSFSAAVKRADDADVLASLLRELLRKTPLLVAQEYRPTEFDWRIGILEGRVLYVCKYFMARGNWQIARHYGSGNSRSGRVEAVPLDRAPAEVTRLALESTSLIGNGLYGVDVKETESGPVLIEINDNPNVERGDEDLAEGERLYDTIIGCFARRIDLASRASQSPSDAA